MTGVMDYTQKKRFIYYYQQMKTPTNLNVQHSAYVSMCMCVRTYMHACMHVFICIFKNVILGVAGHM